MYLYVLHSANLAVMLIFLLACLQKKYFPDPEVLWGVKSTVPSIFLSVYL